MDAAGAMSWLDRFLGSFREAPAPAPRGDPERVAQVERVLAELRPAFEADGGDVQLVSVEGGWVEVRLRGACTSCHASALTLQGALEPKLREGLDWVAGVRAV
jgi:Fe-S cluster biogenesis protein NfuA